MAFLSKISRALGFGSDEENYDTIIADDPDSEIASGTTPSNSDSENGSKSSAPQRDDAAMHQRIFTHVVDTFNAALPDFLSNSVDPTKQRQCLYDGLEADIRKYIDDIASDARRRCADEWSRERQKLQDKLNEVESRARDIESKRDEMTQKQLSSDRQRRALSDRVLDLEKQVAQLEAEREQFQLESRSLQNKLKVANVQEKENDDLHEENIRLRKELNNLRNGNPDAAASAEADNETKKRLDDAMQKLQQAENKVNENTVLLNQKDAEIAALRKEAEELRANANNEDDSEILRDLEQKIESFEDVSRKKDARISDLQKSERALKSKISDLEKQIKDLQEDAQASTPAEKPAQPAAEARPIDDILSDTDWLVSPASLKPKSNRNQHRNNKNNHDKNDQMSLF